MTDLVGMAESVCPETRLRTECLRCYVFRGRILAGAFFAIDEGRQPLIVTGILAPAIEIKVITGLGGTVVVPVETHDVVIPVFHPYASDETPLLALHQRINVEDQTAISRRYRITAHACAGTAGDCSRAWRINQ